MSGVFANRDQSGRRARGGVLVVVMVLLGSACGDRPDEAAGDDIDLAAFCDGVIQGKARFSKGPELDDQGNPTEESLEQLRVDMAPLLSDIKANNPDSIRSEVETVLAGAQTGLDTGDPQSFQTPEYLEANAALDEYVFENCEFQAREEFVAIDYDYEELPEIVSAGRIGFRMDNQGNEVHDAMVVRIDDDTGLTLLELFGLLDEQREQMTEFKGVTFAGPGSSGYGVVDLEPGRYGFICFVEVGTTSLESLFEGGGEDERPASHFAQGMFAEVTVR